MEREWPKALIAPTGSGKTAAVTLGWAAQRQRFPETTPRRLIWCLPMRSLVEQTAKVVGEWFCRLAAETSNDSNLPGPDDVHILMGGFKARNWFERPENPAVLVGTQDMLLSRALMRGYAAPYTQWPIEFALLHDDAQWVFDEVQLMGAGRATSLQLEAFRQCEASRIADSQGSSHRPTRSLWISATLEKTRLKTVDHAELPPEAIVQVDPSANFESSPGDNVNSRLVRVARAKKPLRLSDVHPASAKSADIERYISALAQSVVENHRVGHMTLVIVNRVARAQALYRSIQSVLNQRTLSSPKLALVHSRLRPVERKKEMEKISDNQASDVIVVATQAVEAGVDISAAVLFTELAPWSSIVQRFGRANRYAEFDNGAAIFWIDMFRNANETSWDDLSAPYASKALDAARAHLTQLVDVAPVNLPSLDPEAPPLRVIRRKDIYDLFDTDPDLGGFHVDISAFVRDANDSDIRVFWRDLSNCQSETACVSPNFDELCAVPIGAAKDWLRKVRKKFRDLDLVFVRDPQWRKKDASSGKSPSGWRRFRDAPWPGMVLLVGREAGGYDATTGFTGDLKHTPTIAESTQANSSSDDEEGYGDDPRSAASCRLSLVHHLNHVVAEAETMCRAISADPESHQAIVRAARWHDVGKAHEVFQDTMRRGLFEGANEECILAKTDKKNLRHKRQFFRHELASMLAFLDHQSWAHGASLVAYLIAAHHGKVRLNLRALPNERAPESGQPNIRFARGIRGDDFLQAVDLGANEEYAGGKLQLSIMELGWNETTRESWAERTYTLLKQFGPFRLAWMEAIVRLADWRASAKEREGSYDDN